MATQLYKGYLIISRAYLNKETESWLPEITVSWSTDGRTSFHSIAPTRDFKSESEAIFEGFALARLWIDKRV